MYISNSFIVLTMLFCHIIDDYKLQGILASMKQKQWWKENAPQHLYKYDYLVALIMHSISWSFMIMLPIALYNNFVLSTPFITAFILNVVCHACVDDLKANKRKINLIVDQLIHVVQIAVTAIILLN